MNKPTDNTENTVYRPASVREKSTVNVWALLADVALTTYSTGRQTCDTRRRQGRQCYA